MLNGSLLVAMAFSMPVLPAPQDTFLTPRFRKFDPAYRPTLLAISADGKTVTVAGSRVRQGDELFVCLPNAFMRSVEIMEVGREYSLGRIHKGWFLVRRGIDPASNGGPMMLNGSLLMAIAFSLPVLPAPKDAFLLLTPIDPFSNPFLLTLSADGRMVTVAGTRRDLAGDGVILHVPDAFIGSADMIEGGREYSVARIQDGLSPVTPRSNRPRDDFPRLELPRLPGGDPGGAIIDLTYPKRNQLPNSP
jgi:hypothetical protein